LAWLGHRTYDQTDVSLTLSRALQG